MVRRSQRWIKQQARLSVVILGALTLIAADGSLRNWASGPLPSPEAAQQQGATLTPEELVRVELDEELRDRLRFDPAWQPILAAVRQDIMTLKWGDNQLSNPVWERYGPQALPVLDYYARSADPTRQIYGIVGIRRLGPPYTTLWLEHQLQRSASAVNVYSLTQDTRTLLDPGFNGEYDSEAWQREFGLTDPATRERLIALARQGLEPPGSPEAYVRDGFQRNFLYAMDAPPEQAPGWSEWTPPETPEWDRLAALAQPTEAQIQEAIALYQRLEETTQLSILADKLGPIPAGELPPLGQALLQTLADEGNAFEQVWAIAELERHGDAEASRRLQTILNSEDLTPLYPLTQSVAYRSFWEAGPDVATHAYYLLLGIVDRYPNARFVQAARAYGDLRGQSYFGGVPRSGIVQNRLARQTPAERTAQWQAWLERYGDHPGADDATYWLARSLQDEGRILEAMDLWISLMEDPIGDQDATYLAWPHLRTLLDVGLSTDQLRTLLERQTQSGLAPLLQYALAVHEARSHQYAEALRLSQDLDLTQASLPALESYYDRWSYFWTAETVRQDMQTMLSEQRQRWQQLYQWQQAGTPAAQYQIASNWADAQGWKNGYLAMWDESRTYLLPTGTWGMTFCEIYWTCNVEQRGTDAVRMAYQNSSQLAIAIQLYQALIANPSTPAELREKAMFMSAASLLWQWEDHPLGETIRIHPAPGVTTSPAFASMANDRESYDEWEKMYQHLERDYQQAVDEQIAQLQQDYPQSRYIDELLFSQYFVSGQPQYLEQIVQTYPQGDRAAEARFILQQRVAGQ